MRLTKKNFEEYLNELNVSDEEMIIGGKQRYGRYGTMLRKYDVIAFNVAYREWKEGLQ
jgi:hypothetical protein